MDTMYFKELPDPIEISENVQLPQFKLVDTNTLDCSQNYTSGFSSLIRNVYIVLVYSTLQ